MNPRLLAACALLAAGLSAGCRSCPRGGLEGRTLDTPQRAFEYFQAAVELERYDLEYGVYSEEFIDAHGGFSLADYVRGRPWATGEVKELIDGLHEAKIEKTETSRDGHLARLTLVSDDFRAVVTLVRKTTWRVGLDYEELPAPLEGTVDDLAARVSVKGDDLVLRVPAGANSRAILGTDPPPEDVTLVEAKHRWYLLSVDEVGRRRRGGP